MQKFDLEIRYYLISLQIQFLKSGLYIFKKSLMYNFWQFILPTLNFAFVCDLKSIYQNSTSVYTRTKILFVMCYAPSPFDSALWGRKFKVSEFVLRSFFFVYRISSYSFLPWIVFSPWIVSSSSEETIQVFIT